MASETTNGSVVPIQVGEDHFRSHVVVLNEMGLHARPASMLVALCNRYASDVSVTKGEERVDGKSILQLLSLSAEAGTQLSIETRGVDAHAAIVALMELFASGFNELNAGPASPK